MAEFCVGGFVCLACCQCAQSLKLVPEQLSAFVKRKPEDIMRVAA